MHLKSILNRIQGSSAESVGRTEEFVGHRQTHSVRVCSPASRRVAALRPRSAGLRPGRRLRARSSRLLSDDDQS